MTEAGEASFGIPTKPAIFDARAATLRAILVDKSKGPLLPSQV